MRRAWIWVAAAPLVLGLCAFGLWSGLHVLQSTYNAHAAGWRASFISEAADECIKESRSQPTLKDVLDDTQLIAYCKCFMNDLLDHVTMTEIIMMVVGRPPSRTEAKVDAAATACMNGAKS